jgi:5-methylcytosine-specific restriction protein A
MGHSPALAELLETEYSYDSVPDYPDEVISEFWEGQRQETSVNRYERDPEARAACLRYYGSYSCQICGFDFENAYGSIGKKYIHVHHLQSLAALGKNGRVSIDPKKDMLPVCPNCHAMLHTRKPEPWAPEDIKNILRL